MLSRKPDEENNRLAASLAAAALARSTGIKAQGKLPENARNKQ
jgi:hypothetical protein